MRIAILGTGGIALGYAALLNKNNHDVVLYSLSGKGHLTLDDTEICAVGAFKHQFHPNVTDKLTVALDGAEAIIVATTLNNHQALFDALVPQISEAQEVLISGELSMSGSSFFNALKAVGKCNSVTSLATTILTARRQDPAVVKIGILRKVCKASTEPADKQDIAIAFWQSIFGPVIDVAPCRLWVTFSNLNPTVHASNALCNFTRIEAGESWSNYDGFTEGVARLTVALDKERVAVATAYEVEVVPLLEHYQSSFGFPSGTTFNQMAKSLHESRAGLPKGPTEVETRYVTEDVPFGLVFIEFLAKEKGMSTPLHSASINLFSAIYGRNFRIENTLI